MSTGRVADVASNSIANPNIFELERKPKVRERILKISFSSFSSFYNMTSAPVHSASIVIIVPVLIYTFGGAFVSESRIGVVVAARSVWRVGVGVTSTMFVRCTALIRANCALVDCSTACQISRCLWAALW